ncbi:MAG: HAD hydrolase family protein, partial [Planctomycetota bacterium]
EELPSKFDRLQFAKSEPEYLEITAAGVNKGSALPALASYYGFEVSEVLAIGDADNDNPMLVEAGVGVAVSNARESTKAAADFVTIRSNNDAGVAEAVDRFAL